MGHGSNFKAGLCFIQAWRTYIASMKKTSQLSFFARHSFAIAMIIGSVGPFLHYVLGL